MSATAMLAAAIGLVAQELAPAREDVAPEIIVTGERAPRSLRETPSSVAVTTAADIDRMAAPDRIEQILEMIPNVQLGPGTEGPVIRGQDTTGPARDLYAFLGGYKPRTTLIVDGRPVGFNEFISGVAPIWDVERVEVYRSPQTTTQGKNSIAGAIFIYTEDPSMDAEFRARAIAGQAETSHLSAAFSGSVVHDQVAFRIAGDYRYNRPSSDIRDRVPGADADRDEYGLLRFKLLATPEALPGARLELTYSHSESQMPQSELIRAPFRNRENRTGFAGIARMNVDAVTADLRYEISPDSVVNVLATRGDSDMRRFALPGLGQTEIETKDWFAEAVVRWSPYGPLQLVGGVSYLRQRLRQHINPLILFGEGTFDDLQDGSGIFGEARFALSSKATLTAGLRYQRDRQKRTGVLGSGSSAANLNFDRSFDAWLPKVSFAYDLTPTFKAGVLVQRAYNPGGVTLRADAGIQDVYEAETLWDYEFFARASFAGGILRATANLFYYDIRDAQRAQPYIVEGVGFADLFNAPKARSHGMEAQLDWRPSDRFSAALAFGLLRTKIVRAGPSNVGFDGKEFQRSPHFSLTASMDWRPLQGLRLSAQARHNGGYWSDDLNSPSRRVDSWTKVNARAEWTASSRFRLFGYARNVFDNFYLTYVFNPILATAGDPREMGLGLEMSF